MKLISCTRLGINKSNRFIQAFQMGMINTPRPVQMNGPYHENGLSYEFVFYMRLFMHRNKKVIQIQFNWVQWGMFKNV